MLLQIKHFSVLKVLLTSFSRVSIFSFCLLLLVSSAKNSTIGNMTGLQPVWVIIVFNYRSLSALSAYHTGLIAPMKIRTEAPGNLRLYSGSPTRSEKEQVSISSFYYKERVSARAAAFDSYPFSWILVPRLLPGAAARLVIPL